MGYGFPVRYGALNQRIEVRRIQVLLKVLQVESLLPDVPPDDNIFRRRVHLDHAPDDQDDDCRCRPSSNSPLNSHWKKLPPPKMSGKIWWSQLEHL
jgi:hypothetical protein